MASLPLTIDAATRLSESRRYAALWLFLIAALVLRIEHIVHVLAPLDGNFDDLRGRVGNLTQLQQTGNIYFPSGYEAFTYPPAAIALFEPLLVIPTGTLPFVWTTLCVFALIVTYAIALGALLALQRRERWSLALIGAWCTITLTPASSVDSPGANWRY